MILDDMMKQLRKAMKKVNADVETAKACAQDAAYQIKIVEDSLAEIKGQLMFFQEEAEKNAKL